VRIDRGAAHPTPESVPLTDVIERLVADFDSQVSRPVVSAIVQRCRTDLDIVAPPALSELVERLARQRLHDLVTARSEFTAPATRWPPSA
jgi:hypothetical protein